MAERAPTGIAPVLRSLLSRGWMAPTALVVALVSILLNLLLVWQLRHPEQWAAPVLQRLAGGLADADGVIRYDVRIPAGTPINLDIPVNERFAVRVDTVIPINTRVRLPLRSPLGNYSVSVPIRANVPVRTRLPLHIRHNFRLRTRTPEPIVVPIQLKVEDLLK